LVDSIIAELNRLGLTAHLVIHPVIAVRRDRRGQLLGLAAAKPEDAVNESFIQCWITRQPDDRLKEIERALDAVLAEVRAAVEDWRPMREKLETVLAELRTPPTNIVPEDCDEARDFLRWVHSDHFTFLGYRDYDIAIGSRESDVTVRPKAGLGVLRKVGRRVFNGLRDIAKQPKEVRDFVRRPELMMVTKSNLRSVIHRPVVMDAIGVKRFNRAGKVIGQRVFVGLFTSSAYSRSPRDIPILRRKIQQVIKRAGFPPSGHAGKALSNILETYPRDELLQISESDLYRASMSISHLQDR